MKGIYKEVQRHFGKSVDNYIIAARTAQGWEAWLQIDKDEQMEIVHRYLKLVEEVKRKKIVGGDSVEAVQEFIEQGKEKRREHWGRMGKKKEQLSGEFREKGRKWSEKVDSWQDKVHINRTNSVSSVLSPQRSILGRSTSELLKPEHRTDIMNGPIGQGLAVRDMPPVKHIRSTGELRHAATAPQEQTYYHDSDDDDYRHDANFEKALQESIKQTSQGNADEDQDIDKAIRASIAHLRHTITMEDNSAVDGDDAEDEQLKLAIAESLKSSNGAAVAEEQETGVLRPPAIPPRSPRRSISPHVALSQAADELPDYEPGGSSLEAGAHAAAEHQDADENDFKKALEESQKMGEDEDKARREEEIVLEYVKKQSLLEENYRMSVGQGAGGAASGGEVSGTR
jgi:hypothetical protein